MATLWLIFRDFKKHKTDKEILSLNKHKMFFLIIITPGHYN